MKIFEVGFVCPYEGGHGSLIGVEGDPLELARKVIFEQLHSNIQYWCDAVDVVENEYEEEMRHKNLSQLLIAKQEAIDAKTLDDLKGISVNELCLISIVEERKVRTE